MHTMTTPTNHHLTRRIRNAVAAGAIGLLACGSLAACGASSPATKATGTTSSTAAVGTTTTAKAMGATTVAANNSAAGGGGANGSQPNGGQSGGNTTPGGGSGGSTSTTAPTISSFTTPDNIDCHNGNSQTFSVSWATQNATKVTISIDGPGIYDTYGPNGNTSLPFGCSSSHTFLLTVFGTDGTTVTKQITLQPRNVQVPDQGDQPTT